MKRIYFYKTSSGNEVVTKFIDKLDNVTKVHIRNNLRLLEKHGLELLKSRSVKKILSNPNIFELRVKGKKQIRMLFTLYDKDAYLVVHIFVKKAPKTPRKELHTAQKRAKEFI